MQRKKLKQTTAIAEEYRSNPSPGEEMPSTQNSKPPKKDPEAFARRYQLEVFQRAKEENIIAYLDTGAGKTLIAVLLIKAYAHLLRKPQNNYAVFLVPTVVLVRQQAAVLEIHTDLKVGQYWGEMGVDLWDREKWQKELNTYEVFVMTPQILLDNLRHCFFTLDTIILLIFDECHHARKKNPYALIMHEFYHRIYGRNGENPPRIFGMTASPVYCKGVSSAARCVSEVSNLEKTLNAKVYTLEDTTELEGVLVSPDVKINYYDFRGIPNDLLKKLRRKLEFLQEKHTRFEESFAIDGPTLERARKKIVKLHLTILFCAEDMGIWCAAKASEILLKEKVKAFVYDPRLHEFVVNARNKFLLDAWNACREHLPSDLLWKCGVDLEADVSAGFLSSKVQCLIQTLLYYSERIPLRGIIFVRRVIASMVMGSLLCYLNCFASIKSEYMAGNGSSLQAQTQKQHKQIIDAFREGKVNIIVATQVIEEGLDIQGCNLVIRFDLSDTVCSFIQSRGRARMQGSHYVLLVRRDDADEKKKLDRLLGSVQIMRETALNRSIIPSHLHVDLMPSEELFCVESTGAIATLNSSVALIDYYCSQLPGDRYYTPRPEFHINKSTAECIMELPMNCPISKVTIQGEINLLKQLACLEACKQLHAVGALTHYLLPEREEEDENLQDSREKEDYKKLFPVYAPKEFVGDWAFTTPKVLFYCYYLFFERDFAYTFPFQNVILLVKHALDPSVGNTKICLEVTKGAVSIQTEFAGTLELTSSEVEMATRFQVTVLRLLIASNLDKLSEGIDLHDKTEISKQHMMYLLLPLVNTITSPKLALSLIDWTCIRNASCIDPVKGCDTSKLGISHDIHCILKNKQEDLIQTACGMVPMDMLDNSIVETPHNGKVYCIMNVLKSLNAASSLVSKKSTSGEIRTYTEFFRDRHGITLQYQHQPLLAARPLFKVENFLLRRAKAEKASASNFMAELPPELCKVICLGISTSTLYTFSFLPSVMHRIESMLSAAQLRKIFSNLWPPFSVPTIKVLEALTMKNCQECMSLETLETLGDAFLKYVASRNVFTKYRQQHEGQLTSKRMRIISNRALYKISCDRQIPGYIRNERFDPQQWIIPGQHLATYSGDLQDKFHILENMHIKGYRMMNTKNVADVVEALIGACLETGGETVALSFVKWLGMDIDIPQEMPFTRKLDTGFVSNVNVPYLESLLKYSFRVNNLLVESVTHASYKEPSVSGCYQRLEFLGDAVLDYLITLYFYKTYPGLSPGLLTDLRSAAVNNDCYAQAAVRCNLHQQLRHASSVLHNQITDFATLISSTSASEDRFFGWTNTEVAVPKVLGDLIESIAGAILVDSEFNTQLVWNAIKPLLEPIVSPETIEYHPVRELHELCAKGHYTPCFHDVQKEGICTVKVEVRVKDKFYTETCDASNKKTATKLAAEKVLKSLKASGLNNH